MASNKSVIVLAPNGRRQTVRVNPNTTLLQILEEVCSKQGFKAEEYDLKHHNTVLDTSMIIRFSGLPNNAQLELQPATKFRLETDVVLGVHLENGSRLMGNFPPSETVMEVLEKLCPDEAKLESNPVVIYMRKEIFGETLSTTTLRSLGITSGRAMLRLLHRSPEELRKQANVSAPLPTKPVEEKPYIRTLKKVDSPELQPASKEVRQPKPESGGLGGKENHPGNSPNQTENRKESFLVGAAKQADCGKKENFITQYVKQEKRKHTDRSPPPNKAEPMEVDEVCKDQKKVSIKEEVGQITEESIRDEFVFLGERNAMLFSLETARSVPSEDLPDDFFELTIDDAKKILRDIKVRRAELENGNLTTAAMRKLEESKKELRQLNRYKKAIIRVQFLDRTVLQGTFTPTETVQNVVDFVREYLNDKSMDFYLYTTPPKYVLNREHRLIEIGCVPGALLHFGCDSSNIKENHLRKDVMDKFTSNSLASLAAMKMRKQATRAASQSAEDDFHLPDDVNVGASTSAGTSSYSSCEDYPQKSPPVKSVEKVPKWFKPAK